MTEGETWRWVMLSAARRDLRQLDRRWADRILGEIDRLAALPARTDTRKLAGRSEQWRLRVGDYRVIFTTEPEERLITVLRIGHRRDIYRV